MICIYSETFAIREQTSHTVFFYLFIYLSLFPFFFYFAMCKLNAGLACLHLSSASACNLPCTPATCSAQTPVPQLHKHRKPLGKTGVLCIIIDSFNVDVLQIITCPFKSFYIFGCTYTCTYILHTIYVNVHWIVDKCVCIYLHL